MNILPLWRARFQPVLLAVAALLPASAMAAGPLGIDHRWNRADTGVFSRGNQLALEYGSAAFVVGGALIEGNGTALGQTFWHAADAMLITAAGSAGLKVATGRQRPADGNDPSAWGKPGARGFPSGEVAHVTSIVTPFIVRYGATEPAVWLGALLPVYDGVARMKSQAHWQSDVLAGATLGAAVGYWQSSQESSWTASVLPRGLSVGWRHSF